MIYELCFEQDIDHRDVAAMFGVTESRVSQIITAKIKPEVERAYVLAEALDLYKDDPDASRLVVDWIKL